MQRHRHQRLGPLPFIGRRRTPSADRAPAPSGRDRRRGIAGEHRGDRRGRHRAHHQPRAGAGIAEIQCRLGLRQLPTPVPVTRQRPGPSRDQLARRAPRMAPAVECTSSDSSRPVMRVSPSPARPGSGPAGKWICRPAPGRVPLRGPARRAASGLGLALCIRGFKRPLQAGLPVANAPLQQPLLHGKNILVKADLGTKRACPSCDARFYDLTKRPIECPKCGFSYEPEALFKQRRSRVAEPAAAGPSPPQSPRTRKKTTRTRTSESEPRKKRKKPRPSTRRR